MPQASCGDQGDGGCGNFEHLLSRSLAAFYVVNFPNNPWGGVGVSDDAASCSGNDSPNCPWLYFPSQPLPIYNPGNSLRVNSVAVSDSGNNRTYSWNVTVYDSFPAGVYDYYAMVTDTSGQYQSCASSKWDRLTTVTVITPTATATPIPTATPTPGPWTKLKSSSFSSTATAANYVPETATAYDSEDTNQPVFILGKDTGGADAGLALRIDVGNDDRYSTNNWRDSQKSYSKSTNFTPSLYLDYVRSRKEYKNINNLSEIDADKINVIGANQTINVALPDVSPFVLVVTSNGSDLGTVNIDIENFTIVSGNGSMAIIADTINFCSGTDSPVAGCLTTVKEANGIFIANNINTGQTADQGLKIKGNLISRSGFTNNRRWTNLYMPSLFIVRDIQMYMDLLPYISTVTYNWRQLQ
jgi:hypothetical protein